MEKLTSVDIKWIRSLHDKTNRKETGCFIIEGGKLVEESLQQQLFEPVMIVFLGVSVGILLASVLIPIYNVSTGVGI